MSVENAAGVGVKVLELSGVQRAQLTELIIAEQRHASRWWTFLNEMRRRNELPDWVMAQDVGSYPDHDLWDESRKALNQTLFGSDDPGGDMIYQQIEL